MKGSESTDGSAYARPTATYDPELALVSRGAPAGELLRRYWHPVAIAAAVRDIPLKVKVLGEDLILFKTPEGRFGLVYPRCVHRGTTLYYGSVESRGIRCCYHGWLFAPDGRCLEQPCEPGGGKNLEGFRQPWYPVEERYGLVFAYLGPLDKKPLLPRYDILENLAPGETVLASDEAMGRPNILDCNWFQFFENTVDPWHIYVLHDRQFPQEFAIRPDIDFEETATGVTTSQTRKLPDGRTQKRIVEVVLPTIRFVPSPRDIEGKCNNIVWTIPQDDTHTAVLRARVRRPGAALLPLAEMAMYEGRTWDQLTEEEHQRMPGDHEAQCGQGEITLHSEEHLTSSDRGIAMLRRLYRRAVHAVSEGRDPPGTAYSGTHLVITQAGSTIIDDDSS